MPGIIASQIINSESNNNLNSSSNLNSIQNQTFKKQKLINSKIKIQFEELAQLSKLNETELTTMATGTGTGTGTGTEKANETNEKSFASFIPLESKVKDLDLILNHQISSSNSESKVSKDSFSFYINSIPISPLLSLNEFLDTHGFSLEEQIVISYTRNDVFKVRSVSRCSTTLVGHTEAVLAVAFSPDGNLLASGGGDCCVRTWDILTETPRFTLKGHTNWVQHVCWSPDSKYLVSAGMDTTIHIWNPHKGILIGVIKAHSLPITSLSFQPFAKNPACTLFLSTSKDCTSKVWDCSTRKMMFAVSQHTAPVMCSKWGGDGMFYTGSRDKTVKVWDEKTGKLVKSLKGHAHWVNSIALESEYILRTGPYDHKPRKYATNEEAHQAALDRYQSFKTLNPTTLLASCSDDFTIILWTPLDSAKPMHRLTGHQQLVNQISFSPNGRFLASASFDKSIKVWSASGAFINTLRGHVGAVYAVSWAADSRTLISASRDSTCKVWDVAKIEESRVVNMKTCMRDELAGHADQVFCCDWVGGGVFCSAGKDRTLKIWRH